MRRVQRVAGWCVMLLALMGLAMTGAVTVQAKEAKAPDYFAAAPKDKLFYSVTPEAELVDFACYFAKYKKQDSLFFYVTVKNISKEPQRFRVNIFLDNGKAVGGLVPRKGKPPVLKPGAQATVKYPVQGMNAKASSVTIYVKKASF